MDSKQQIPAYPGYPEVDQVQVLQWPSAQFLQPMSGVRLVEHRPWYTNWMCCPRKLFIKGEDSTHYGHSVFPLQTNCGSEMVHINVPDFQRAMQLEADRCNFSECLCPFRCKCCTCFADLVVMNMYDHRRHKMGSLEYRPVCCRQDKYLCLRGEYLIKNGVGDTVMYIPRNSCCTCYKCINCKDCNCKDCNCKDCVALCCSCCLGCLFCLCCLCGLSSCGKVISPVKVLSASDDSLVSHITLIEEDPCKEVFCCKPINYHVDYERPDSTTEDKMLLLSTAVSLDHCQLTPLLTNDLDYQPPDYPISQQPQM